MNRRLIILSATVFVGLILGACGGIETQSERNSGPVLEAPEAPAPAEEQIDQVVAEANETAYQLRNSPRLVIKNGDLSLVVESTAAATNQVTVIATRYGGYIISSEFSTAAAIPTATITVAVEAASFETAMNDLRAIGLEVLHDAATGEDVTAEYVDLESRLQSLEATRSRITSFLDQARNVDEALTVNNELAKIEEEIEQVKGRMTYLSGRSAFSTITVALREPDPQTPPTPAPKPDKWSPRGAFDAAIDAQESLLQRLTDAAIWLVFFSGPYLLIAGVAGWGWWRWQRRRNRA
jgi:hypothetical protein